MSDLIVRAYRLGSFSSHEFKPYVYGGNEPVTAEPPKTRPDSPTCEEAGCDAHAHAVGLCPAHYYEYRKAIRLDPSLRKPRQTGFRADACGTNRGHQRHTYYTQDPCRPCIDAHNVYRAERKAAVKARKEAAA